MAEIIIPWEHTIFLPEGSPAISSINDIQVEMRLNQCGSAAGELYCLGEADILINYQSAPPPSSGGLFGRNAGREEGSSWQALLTLPVELHAPGVDPPVEPIAALGDLDWYMVSDRAVEVEAAVAISDGTIARETPATVSQTPSKKQESGEWIMVTLEEMSKMLSEEEASAQSVEELAAQANATVAKCRELWDKYEADRLQPPAEQLEEQPDEEPQLLEEEPFLPEEPGEEAPPEELYGWMEAQERPEAEQMSGWAEAQEGPEAEQMSGWAEAQEGPEAEQMSGWAEAQEEPEPEPVKGRFALKMVFGANKAEQPQQPEVQQAAAVAPPAAGEEPEPLAVLAQAAVIEETGKIPAKGRRRLLGLPTLHVDAKDNNIEISAFNLNIKL